MKGNKMTINIGDTFSRYHNSHKIESFKVIKINNKTITVENNNGVKYTRKVIGNGIIQLPLMKGSKYTNYFYKD